MHFQEIGAPGSLEMPKLGKLAHIREYLFELDICKSSPLGGYTPLTYGDILDWANATHTVLNQFEIQSLIKLSRTYAVNHAKFDKSAEPDPVVVIRPMNRAELSGKLKDALRSMKVNYG